MTQFESHLSLGQFLRQEREKRGISIEQVASATKIGVRQLHALESDQYAELPARPFIRGFVTSYVRFVGLDHKEVLTHFNSFIDSKVHERPNREAGHSGYVFERREGSDQSRMILGIVMGTFVVLGAVTIVLLKPTFLHRHKHTHVDSLRAAHPHAQTDKSGEVSQAVPEVADASSGVVEPAPAVSTSAVPETVAQATPSKTSATPISRSSGAPAPVPATVADSQVAPPKRSPAVPERGQDVHATKSDERGQDVHATKSDERGQDVHATLAGASQAPSETSAMPAVSKTTETAPVDSSDPLNSGHGLKPIETAQRIVVRATETVWVRYRVDDKTSMRFPLKKGKILVLRARHDIVLQLGNPSYAEISHNGAGYRPVPSFDPTDVNSDATLLFPPKVIEMDSELFPGEKPISTRAVTVSHSTLSLPTTH